MKLFCNRIEINQLFNTDLFQNINQKKEDNKDENKEEKGVKKSLFGDLFQKNDDKTSFDSLNFNINNG